MEAGRKLREEQYAALKDKEWEDTLRREAELHRCVACAHGSCQLPHCMAPQPVQCECML